MPAAFDPLPSLLGRSRMALLHQVIIARPGCRKADGEPIGPHRWTRLPLHPKGESLIVSVVVPDAEVAARIEL
jgi:hypothetical protein